MMKSLLFRLLKLLLQLLIFALTGTWPRFGVPAQKAPKPKRAGKPKQRPKQKRPQAAPARGGALYAEERDLEAEQESLELLFGREEGGAPVRRVLTRARPARPTETRAREALGAALRSPSAIRDALVLGAALGPRTPRR